VVGFRLPAVPNWFKVLVTWPQRSCSDASQKRKGILTKSDDGYTSTRRQGKDNS
jgi:hypothetical protein